MVGFIFHISFYAAIQPFVHIPSINDYILF